MVDLGAGSIGIRKSDINCAETATYSGGNIKWKRRTHQNSAES